MKRILGVGSTGVGKTTLADTAVWLDYPLPLILWRLFNRTIWRTIGQEALWNGNRERFMKW